MPKSARSTIRWAFIPTTSILQPQKPMPAPAGPAVFRARGQPTRETQAQVREFHLILAALISPISPAALGQPAPAAGDSATSSPACFPAAGPDPLPRVPNQIG